MRILIDLRLLTKGGMTGIEEYTVHLVGRLIAMDKTNEYVFFYNGLKKAPLPDKWLNKNVSVINWNIPNKFFDLLNQFNIPKLDKIIPVDAIFSPHFNIISHTQNTPHIMTFHDLSFMHHPEFFSARKKIWHWMQKYKDRAKKADRIIAVSEFTKWDLVERLGITPEKISVIYSGISPDIKPTPGTLGIKRPYMLYLGAIEPRKNVNAAIRAFNILKTMPGFSDWEFKIAGNFGWLYKGVLKEVSRSPYKNDIKFIGQIRSSDRAAIYTNAQLFIYPSFFEGFGFPPLEAQACGVPVIASNRTSLPEILGNSAILVNPWNIDEIVSAAKTIIYNPKERERLINAGFENSKKFNWENAAKKTLEIITKNA